MNCHNPFVKGGQAFGCSQCLPCRINRKRIWQHRIMLEAKDHEKNAFVTLSYSDDKIPEGGTLVPAHCRDFLKRLRSRVEPIKIRHYLVGEYGDESERPHYHAILFGYPSCQWGRSRYSKTKSRCCIACDTVSSCWGHGHVFLGEVTPESAAYVCGYVTKKLTAPDPVRLGSRSPEFARMSNRPGIGAGLMHDVASSLLQYPEALAKLGDVPGELSHGTRKYPLGRYLKRKLRETVGLSPDAPALSLIKYKAELQVLQKVVEENLQVKLPLKASIQYASLGKRLQTEARYQRHRQRRHL